MHDTTSRGGPIAADFVYALAPKVRRIRAVRGALLISTALFASALPALAQDATWKASTVNGDFNTSANWNTGSVPTDTAFFGQSTTTALWFSDEMIIGGWTFNSGASAYTFTNGNYLEFMGDGITINGGGVTINNDQSLSFYFRSTAGSAAITNNDSLSFNDSSTAGSAVIINKADLEFYDNSTADGATINNIQSLYFYSDSTAGSASITNNAFLSFSGASTAGSAVIINESSLVFNDTSTAGSAAILNGNAGIVDFLSTSGLLGDHKITAGSIAGLGEFKLGANELTVGSNNLSTEVSGVVSGSGGSLVKTGTGTLTLSGDNTYDGATSVNAGGLIVNGSIASSSVLNVNSGAFVGGVGTLSTTTIANGGTLAPGNSIGTITVNGNLTFNAGSFYTVEVSPAAADRTNVVGGSAMLTGATVQAHALPGSFQSRTYTILHADGGLAGTQFADLNVTGSFSPARNPHLTYDLNNVYLVLDPGAIGLPQGASGNQASVAAGINNAVENGTTPPAAFDTLLNMGGAQLTNALDQLSGQAASGAEMAGQQMTTSFMGLMLHPFGSSPGAGTGGSSGALGYARDIGAGAALSPEAAEAYAAVTPKDKRAAAASFDQRWSFWGNGYGGTSRTAGDAATSSAGSSARAYGFAAGVDYRAAPDLLVGFALAGGGASWGLAQNLGSGRANVFQIGAYGSKTFGAAYVSGGLTYAWHDVSADRTITVAGLDKLEANFNAHSFGGRIEGGYRFTTPWLGVTPYGALQVQNFRTPGYTESAVQGSGTFALAYNSRSVTSTRVELGAWFDKVFALDGGNALALRSRAAWANDQSNDAGINAVFQTLPGASFTVNGAAVPNNVALLSQAAELRLTNGVAIGVRFDGEFAARAQTYAGTGTLRYTW